MQRHAARSLQDNLLLCLERCGVLGSPVTRPAVVVHDVVDAGRSSQVLATENFKFSGLNVAGSTVNVAKACKTTEPSYDSVLAAGR